MKLDLMKQVTGLWTIYFAQVGNLGRSVNMFMNFMVPRKFGNILIIGLIIVSAERSNFKDLINSQNPVIRDF
jgi:hypothetical protein